MAFGAKATDMPDETGLLPRSIIPVGRGVEVTENERGGPELVAGGFGVRINSNPHEDPGVPVEIVAEKDDSDRCLLFADIPVRFYADIMSFGTGFVFQGGSDAMLLMKDWIRGEDGGRAVFAALMEPGQSVIFRMKSRAYERFDMHVWDGHRIIWNLDSSERIILPGLSPDGAGV